MLTVGVGGSIISKCLRMLTVLVGGWVLKISMPTVAHDRYGWVVEKYLNAFRVVENGVCGLTLTKDKYNNFFTV